jgi:hypothetical protein
VKSQGHAVKAAWPSFLSAESKPLRDLQPHGKLKKDRARLLPAWRQLPLRYDCKKRGENCKVGSLWYIGPA